MLFIEKVGNLVLGFVNSGGDNMARIFARKLNNIFAEIGFDRLDIV